MGRRDEIKGKLLDCQGLRPLMLPADRSVS
jgi:hypothetical protein